MAHTDSRLPMTTQWDLFRTFETVARLGSLTAAAKALGVSQSTISRQMSRLEEHAESPLLVRDSPLQLTERGEAVLAAVRPMLDAALAAQTALEDRLELRGEVTVTTVGELLRWVLADHLPGLFRAHPELRLRILVDNKLNSLAAGEADVALRLARPVRGDLVARKLCTESFGLYASVSLDLQPHVPWLGVTRSLAEIPEQRHADQTFVSRPARLRVEDVEALGVAVQAGVGVAVLPRQLAKRLIGVHEIRPEQVGAKDIGAIPPRDVWAVIHRSKQYLPKVRAVIGWLERAFDGHG